VRRGPAGMDDALRDALVIEVRDLLPEVEVFEQCRTPQPCLQRVVSIGEPYALSRRQELARLCRSLRGGRLGRQRRW
jgi:hypothetical protein